LAASSDIHYEDAVFFPQSSTLRGVMRLEIKAGPAFANGEVTLAPNAPVRVEAGAMAMQRTIGGESFFVNDFSAGAGGGVVGVAAALPGDMILVDFSQGQTIMVQSGSWIASNTRSARPAESGCKPEALLISSVG
jgi:uncharacterized protein (AIM24 family)